MFGGALGGFFFAEFGFGGFFCFDDGLGSVLGALWSAAFFGGGVGGGLGGLSGWGCGIFARAAAFALADGGAFGVGEFEAVALFGAVDVVGGGVAVEFVVVEVDDACGFFDGFYGVGFGVEPGSVGEDGGVAFDDDFVAGFGEEDEAAHGVFDDGVW